MLLGAGGDPSSVSADYLVGGERSVVGSITGTPCENERALDFNVLTGVRPEIETMPLAEVNRRAEAHVADVEEDIPVLQQLQDALHHLAAHGRCDDRPDCPIVEGLAGAVRPETGRITRRPASAASATYARIGV